MSQQSDRYETLMRDLDRAGLYQVPDHRIEAVLAGAHDAGFAVWRVPLAKVKSKRGLMNTLARVMEFPDWFGHNWDALEDCLTDLDWVPHPNGKPEVPGFALLLDACDAFKGSHREDFETLLEICASASEYWREERRPFWTLVDVKPNGHTEGILGELEALPELG